MELARCFPDDEASQIEAIEFSILRGAKHLITNGDHRARDAPTTSCLTGSKPGRTRTNDLPDEELFSKIGKL